MTESEPWTVLRLLKWTEQYLSERGSDSPRLDAEILLATARNCQRIDLYLAFNEVADESVRTTFRELVRQRAEGTPVAYLVGSREFYSRSFHVTPDVLIPRPESEFIIVELLDRVEKQLQRTWKVVDVGTGSGILAINAALELPAADVLAIDISPAALQVARKNAKDHALQNRLRFAESDLLTSESADSKFDFVLSNPPYVSEAEFAELDPQVKDHEPRVALVAGEHGTSVIERLIPQAADHLVSGGWLIFEISPMIEARVVSLFHRDGRFEHFKTTKDLAQHARVISAQRRIYP